MGRFLSKHRYTSSIRDVCLHGYERALPAPPHSCTSGLQALVQPAFQIPLPLSLPHSQSAASDPSWHPKAHVPALPHCLQEDRYGVGEEHQQHQAPHNDCAVLVAAVGLHNRGKQGYRSQRREAPPPTGLSWIWVFELPGLMTQWRLKCPAGQGGGAAGPLHLPFPPCGSPCTYLEHGLVHEQPHETLGQAQPSPVVEIWRLSQANGVEIVHQRPPSRGRRVCFGRREHSSQRPTSMFPDRHRMYAWRDNPTPRQSRWTERPQPASHLLPRRR